MRAAAWRRVLGEGWAQAGVMQASDACRPLPEKAASHWTHAVPYQLCLTRLLSIALGHSLPNALGHHALVNPS